MNIAVIKLRGVSTNKKYYNVLSPSILPRTYYKYIVMGHSSSLSKYFQVMGKTICVMCRLLNTSLTSVFQALFTFIFNRFDLIPRRSFWRLITSIDLKCIWRRLVCGLL